MGPGIFFHSLTNTVYSNDNFMCYDSKRKAIIGLFRKSFVICRVKNLDRGLEPFIDGLVSVLFDFFSGV